MMYQRDFERLAAALLSVKPLISHEAAARLRDAVISQIGNVCVMSNARFDRDRFVAACDGGPYAPPRRRSARQQYNEIRAAR